MTKPPQSAGAPRVQAERTPLRERDAPDPETEDTPDEDTEHPETDEPDETESDAPEA